MKGPQLKRMTIVIAVCAAIGAIAGIAGSAAAPSSKSAKSAQAQKQAFEQRMQALKKRAFRRGLAGPRVGFAFGLGFGFGGGPVHATAVVPNKDGTGFDTITTDAGTLNSVDGTTVHVKEGTDKKVYKDDVAIDVGSDAKVFRNGAKATLSDLKAGDHVRVITGTPKGNIVIAVDDAFLKQEKKRFGRGLERKFRQFGHGPGGPPPMGPGGPPPMGPGAPGSYPGGDTPGGGTNS